MNLFKISAYLSSSKLIYKLNGFMESSTVEIRTPQYHRNQRRAKPTKESETLSENLKIDLSAEDFSKHRPALGAVAKFFESLTNKAHDGVIVVTRNLNAPTGVNTKMESGARGGGGRKRDDKGSTVASLQFVLMNPHVHLRPVFDDARAVILAGGTMQPFSHLSKQIFSTNEDYLSRSNTFTCGHVVPPENLSVVSFATGPTSKKFRFNYSNRSLPSTIQELGSLVSGICGVVPGGVVLFFTSYAYEEQVMAEWESGGTATRIRSKKEIFSEPREASQVSDLLDRYTRAVRQPTNGRTGALLSCVMGGKMSEGINFKDELGRCVIVVGLPYPNQRDPLLQYKLKYLEQKGGQSHASIPRSDYIDNVCMNTVNQSIGRAIRHMGDYASIVLVDERYRTSRVSLRLPQWIRSSTIHAPSFGAGYKQIHSFFSRK
eukprot:TRINITY_DN3034_c0_g1_i2.p1 TRINITY_DN3034_c0_g1~~TRINITY_DN3034_c0_g1_i2.p1  ORF type:complete len:506 (-),score=81.38 TRINITY_DN3034_c0_g1_i2:141-1436(-)